MLIYVFCLISLVFAGSNKHGRVLDQLETSALIFQDKLVDTRVHFDNLREAVERGDRVQADTVTEELVNEVKDLRELWQNMEQLYASLSREQIEPADWRSREPSFFTTYMTIKTNSERSHGATTSMLMRAWLGLGFGKFAVQPPPVTLNFTIVGDEYLRPGDPVLIMFTNGGLVRGQIAGWSQDGQWIIHEVLPVAFSHRRGAYRIFPLEDVARIEIPRRHNSSRGVLAVPWSIIHPAGDFANSFSIERAKRINLRPDDAQLLQRAQGPNWTLTNETVSIQQMTNEKRPHYARLLFLECDDHLERGGATIP